LPAQATCEQHDNEIVERMGMRGSEEQKSCAAGARGAVSPQLFSIFPTVGSSPNCILTGEITAFLEVQFLHAYGNIQLRDITWTE
jgi:hypothetical protein